MSAALAGPFLELRREEDLAPALVLAVVVHLLLAVVLTFGVRWQSRAPEVVQVELWQPPPPPPAAVQPEPPKPAPVVQPKPEPRIEKPDIALKAPKPKPKPEPKPEAKPKPKPAAKADDAALRRLLAEAAQREQHQFAAERERQAIKDQLTRDAANARFKGVAAWVDRIRNKIRGNIFLPLDIKGNPEALFLVTLLPNGEVLQARLVISSGHAGYDEAVLRAILKSSPLPKPDSPGLFERELKLTFRPMD
ncbi:MAG TPA: energy transducer TonB [Burkholderiales bacterium]|nr:energy transducer TonB [Burkholderiales bacterium]